MEETETRLTGAESDLRATSEQLQQTSAALEVHVHNME